MRCVVCIKQVPSTTKVKLDPVTKTIIRDARQSVVNPFDAYAIEEAVRVKEKTNGSVSVLSMGIPATERLLRDAVARGADRALLLSDRAFAGADTLATSYTLSLGIRRLGAFDLIFCGKMAVDGDTAQIGPELAETLGIPHVTDVTEILELGEKEIKVRRATDEGYEILKVTLPALLCVVKDINMPRMPSIAGIRYSQAAPFEVLGAEALSADIARTGLDGSPTQVVHTFTPERAGECVQIDGDCKTQAVKMLGLIAAETKTAEGGN
ncbi:electron transfer flavoprotein subunit beta/FixA family protein [Synergistaceae bacterium OttesenSCG-928-D05]|nr:electron transfer flavoprotein subunit beta/FixA family protein [Synergistaceae bacterium OttesenSCG-928-D05]